MGEFDLIQRYFAEWPIQRPDVIVGVGDDCALLQVPEGECLAVTTDTLVSGVHFFPDVDPFALGHKALAVNISDLAAMGAEPRWFSLALTLPPELAANDTWLAGFAQGMASLAIPARVQLIGGDTTRGPLSITISAKGSVPADLAIRRSGARPGDLIYVSGTLGGAALAVRQRLKPFLDWEPGLAAYCQHCMNFPQPRYELGLRLRGLATSALDLSDGLAGDLRHILRASHVGAILDLDRIPMSALLQSACAQTDAWQLALGGGDDYELCFTIAPEHEHALAHLAHQINLPLTQVGVIVAGEPDIAWQYQHTPYSFPVQGWDHFYHG